MKRPEQDLQRAVTQYLAILESQGLLVWYPIPNGGKRGRVESAIFKRLGLVRAGVPDLAIVMRGGQSAFIELKAPNGRPTAKQFEMLAKLRSAGALTAVCDNLDAVIATVDGWIAKDIEASARMQ